MIERELKGVVPSVETMVARLDALGAERVFVGVLEDRRLDDAEGTLRARDHVLRVRAYRDGHRVVEASLDWKGQSEQVDGYKVREEHSAPVADPEAMLNVLARAGFRITLAIDRFVWQYQLDGAMVRLERYPRMDDLVEIEGTPDAMERAVALLGLDRATLGSRGLFDFVARYEARTGRPAVLVNSPSPPPVAIDA
jgi:adenylate cyclase class IV